MNSLQKFHASLSEEIGRFVIETAARSGYTEGQLGDVVDGVDETLALRFLENSGLPRLGLAEQAKVIHEVTGFFLRRLEAYQSLLDSQD